MFSISLSREVAVSLFSVEFPAYFAVKRELIRTDVLSAIEFFSSLEELRQCDFSETNPGLTPGNCAVPVVAVPPDRESIGRGPAATNERES
jgi:hypothetical protein